MSEKIDSELVVIETLELTKAIAKELELEDNPGIDLRINPRNSGESS